MVSEPVVPAGNVTAAAFDTFASIREHLSQSYSDGYKIDELVVAERRLAHLKMIRNEFVRNQDCDNVTGQPTPLSQFVEEIYSSP